MTSALVLDSCPVSLTLPLVNEVWCGTVSKISPFPSKLLFFMVFYHNSRDPKTLSSEEWFSHCSCSFNGEFSAGEGLFVGSQTWMYAVQPHLAVENHRILASTRLYVLSVLTNARCSICFFHTTLFLRAKLRACSIWLLQCF